jgi:hypothetical protein
MFCRDMRLVVSNNLPEQRRDLRCRFRVSDPKKYVSESTPACRPQTKLTLTQELVRCSLRSGRSGSSSSFPVSLRRSADRRTSGHSIQPARCRDVLASDTVIHRLSLRCPI